MMSHNDVASYFIWLANESGSFISNLKLQKLVYYAQAWHLALRDAPLFSADFEAWVHGPVIPDLYQQYKHFRWTPINEDASPDAVSDDVQEFLGEVAEVYFGCDAYTLEAMTHAEDPWIRARGNLEPDQSSSNIIKKEWMQEFYRSRAEE